MKQTIYALGIGATEGGGFRDNFGSMTKPFQAGHAAENGTVAVDLAALGWTAAVDILEAPLGFFQAAGGGFDPDAIVGPLRKAVDAGLIPAFRSSRTPRVRCRIRRWAKCCD